MDREGRRRDCAKRGRRGGDGAGNAGGLRRAGVLFGEMCVKGVLGWRYAGGLAVLLGLLSMSAGTMLPGLHPAQPIIQAFAGERMLVPLAACILLMLSDAPFYGNSDAFLLPRTGRYGWALSRIAYLPLATALALLAGAAWTMVLNLDKSDWGAAILAPSPSIYTLAELPNAAIPPGFALWSALGLAWLYCTLWAYVMMAVNLAANRGAGIGFALLGMILDYLVHFYLWLPALHYVSPINNAAFSAHNLFGLAPSQPTVGYSLCYLGFLCLALALGILWAAPRLQFNGEKSRESGER